MVEKKTEEVIVAEYKLHIHCGECARAIEKHIIRNAEIHKVETNRAAQTCTIVGTIKEEELIKHIRKKARKHAEIVPQKVEKKVEEKKVKLEVKDGKEELTVEKKEELKTKDVVVPYFIHCTHAPQWFSDEDPNACSVM
ncbi:hypothetical protein GW17_00026056 [Ensete ventricosum]|uniref:Uncharacterized protein n=1 Tax=Ensete ventricosum TaxID=4639 RepID=A0A444EJ76_ENSVE|nr:hypothetical protein B296_00056594 [Ensete ventricosum]RWW10403.1 hypothetical protein GW17_00026056 [Ensete ventricosum]